MFKRINFHVRTPFCTIRVGNNVWYLNKYLPYVDGVNFILEYLWLQ